MSHMLEFVHTAVLKHAIGPLILACLVSAPLGAQSGSAAAPAATSGSIRGVVIDSVRGGSLADAAVDLLPLGRRVTTNERGEFHFDSVGPGDSYQIRVLHPMLDTLGIALTTPKFSLVSGETKKLIVAVPSPARLVSLFCPPEQIARGPSALIGFVRDPDTGDPIDSATVSLVYDDETFGFAKRPVNRVARLDASGRYKICGLPQRMAGKVQLLRNGTQSAEIPVTTDASSPLALRSLGLSLATQHVVTGKDSVGNTTRILRGNATVIGRVISQSGVPIAGAHVQMDATTAVAVTGPDGRFKLDSIPTGTQTVSVRKIGYSVTDRAVEVSSAPASPITVVMENYIPTLATVVTIAQRDKDLDRIGFSRRRHQGMGLFREGDELPRGMAVLSDALSTLPGIHVAHSGGAFGTRNVIQGSGPGSCVTFVVDGVPWKDVDTDNGSSLDDFIRPDELEAVELYTPSTAPMEFTSVGQSSCQVMVIWTNRRVHGATKQTKPPR